MNHFRKFAILSAAVLMLLSLVACSQSAQETPDETPATNIEVVEKAPEAEADTKTEEEIQQELAAAREQELIQIRAVNVLEDIEIKQAEEETLKANFENVPMDKLEEVTAWQTELGGEEQETYIFIAKVTEEDSVSEIASALLDAASEMPGTKMDGSIQCAYSCGYIILVSAPNSNDILDKFSATMNLPKIETVEDIYAALSQDISDVELGYVVEEDSGAAETESDAESESEEGTESEETKETEETEESESEA